MKGLPFFTSGLVLVEKPFKLIILKHDSDTFQILEVHNRIINKTESNENIRERKIDYGKREKVCRL